MKSLFIPLGGGPGDAPVIDTALSLALPLNAHLEFLHVYVEPAEAARYTPHVDFARGPAIHNALAELEADGEARLTCARRCYLDLLKETGIAESRSPHLARGATACYHEEAGNGLERLLSCARHHDAIIVARHGKSDGLAADRLERLLVESGRPLIIVPESIPAPLLDCIVVGWRESADAARALGAAMPLLQRARDVRVVAVLDDGADLKAGLTDVVEQLKWSGISATASVARRHGRSTAHSLLAAARECAAGLLVMGGYGHSRAREMVLGGCTQEILDRADIPVFMLH